jgi:subtilase family serine protease
MRKMVRRRTDAPVKTGRVCAEAMEPRVLFAYYVPAQIRQFYGVNSISFNGVTGDGAGQTIAIVDAYDQPDLLDTSDPNFVNSDLHNFDVMFGLPDPPSFTKIDENGGTNLPTQVVDEWAQEESLDVEWAHAMAPMANIVLVECNSNSDSDLFDAGVVAAQNYPGVSVISMSFDEPEPTNIRNRDSLYSSTTGITYVASAGDYGSQNTGYPAFSSYVIGVGGTTITAADSAGDYGSEVVWNNVQNGTGTGGAISEYERKPPYQSSIAIGGNYRDVPDVAFDGDPDTGVYVYDSAVGGGTGYVYGGTSVGSPCWAGLIAVADQGRSLEGLGPMTGYSQTLPRLYSLPSSDFHDITSGNNGQYGDGGYNAGPGYDLTTGLGTPIASSLVPDLAGGDTITGQVFEDNHGNTTFQSGDTTLGGQTVYLDLNNTGSFVTGDPTAVTNASGIYTFTDLVGGLSGTLRLLSPPSGFFLIPNDASVTTAYSTAQTINFSLFPTTYSTSVSSTNYTLDLDATATTEQILVNGVVTYTVDAALVPYMTFTFTGDIDEITVDATNGNPIPSGGITLNGASSGSLLNVIGSEFDADSFLVTSNSITFGADPINFSNVSLLTLNPGLGIDSLEVDSGGVTISPPSPGQGILIRQFSTLSVASDGEINFATAPSHSDRTLVEASTLAATGKLDLGGNDMIVHGGDLTAVTAMLASGFACGTWTGNGIDSSAAAADTTHLTSLGIISNDLGGGNTLYGGVGQNLFDGIAPLASDLLIKYTYYGDTNLDGKIDGSDYSRIDNAVLLGQTGWSNGDFNYDGTIDELDYLLMDNAYNTQGPQM